MSILIFVVKPFISFTFFSQYLMLLIELDNMQLGFCLIMSYKDNKEATRIFCSEMLSHHCY